MSYTPHTLTLTGNMQSFIYGWSEIFIKWVFPFKFEREMFNLSDGGTIAIDWVIDHEGGIPVPGSSQKRPILALFAGLAGGNDNLYFYSMMRDAINTYKIKEGSCQGYKCVVVNFRGAANVPMTSPKLYWLNTWEDVRDPIEYIH